MTLREELARLVAEQPGISAPQLHRRFGHLPSGAAQVSSMLAKMTREGQCRRAETLSPSGLKKTYQYWPIEQEQDMSWQTYEAAAKRAFPKGTRISQERGGSVNFYIPCAAGHSVVEHFKMRMPPDKAHTHLGNKGWKFWGKRTYCPEHNQTAAAPVQPVVQPEQQKEVTMTEETVLGSAMKDAGVTPASVNTREAKRLALMLLEEKFDPLKGAYRDSYSDAKVAHETGIGQKWIAEQREELYGEIKEPAEIAEFRNAVSDIEAKLARMEGDAKAWFENMRKEVERQRNNIDIIVRRNGW